MPAELDAALDALEPVIGRPEGVPVALDGGPRARSRPLPQRLADPRVPAWLGEAARGERP